MFFQRKNTGTPVNKKLSFAGLLIAVGIVYGDIGTSPLYVMKSVVDGNGGIRYVSDEFVIGSLSLIFWTVTLITSIKYVGIVLRADNKGEGGILALYTLVRKKGKWLLIPAMIGTATLLADGMLTPSLSVTSAVEGLRNASFHHHPIITTQNQVVLTACIILSFIFFIQHFGTSFIGKMFGPIMMTWFCVIGVIGAYYVLRDLSILRALSPYYGIKLLADPDNRVGISILGSVFLATTGAEALYADLGHVGRKNIYLSWPFIKTCLILNYFGQGVWITEHVKNHPRRSKMFFNPFYEMLPQYLLLPMIILATFAAVIASQALISGSFTIVVEATRLKLLPRLRTIYPTDIRGQVYVPAINIILWACCILFVIYFRTTYHMENAYGLAITITMLMTTILLIQFLRIRKINPLLIVLVGLVFGTLESFYFFSNLTKVLHGGLFTLLITGIILCLMFIWWRGGNLKRDQRGYVKQTYIPKYKTQLAELRQDSTHSYYATNLVYITTGDNSIVKSENKYVSKNVFYSILDLQPKRANAYWFITVNVTDEPYTSYYTADTLGTDFMVNVQLYLGFRLEQNMTAFVQKIVLDLVENGQIAPQNPKYGTRPNRKIGDLRYVILQEELSPNTRLNTIVKLIIRMQLFMQKHTLSPIKWYGLEYAETEVESIPLLLGKTMKPKLTRVDN